jgi:hypothetical protein
MNLDSSWFMLQKLVIGGPITETTISLIRHLYLSVRGEDVQILMELLMHLHMERHTVTTILSIVTSREMDHCELDFTGLVDKLISSYVKYRLDMPHLLVNLDIILSYVPNIGTEEMLFRVCQQVPPCTALVEMLRHNGVEASRVMTWALQHHQHEIIHILTDLPVHEVKPPSQHDDDTNWLMYIRHLFSTDKKDENCPSHCQCDTNYNYILMRYNTDEKKANAELIRNAYTPISRKRSRITRNTILKEQITQKTKDYQNLVEAFSQEDIADIPCVLLLSITQNGSTYGFDLGHLYQYLSVTKEQCNPFNKHPFSKADLQHCYEAYQHMRSIMSHVPICPCTKEKKLLC